MRRIAFMLLYDGKGIVDEYIEYMLEHLSRHVDTIIAVSNGPVNEDGAARVKKYAKHLWLHENIGFDVWAYKDALDRYGWSRLANFDEVILLNYTFFGPIGGFEELFNKMDASDVDFWGITEHAEYSPNPLTGYGTMPAHIQSHWIAVRKSLHQHEEFRRYWETMPMISSYNDSILYHESRFTKHFADLGFRYEVAFPARDYPSPHPIFDNAELMVERGCPILKRRTFFHDPFYLDRHGILGGRLIELAAERGYPVELMWRNLVRTTPPRILQTNTGGMRLFDPQYPAVSPQPAPRVLAIAHIYYPDLAEEILAAFKTIPGSPKLLATTADEQSRAAILEVAKRMGILDLEVRIAASNRGRDVSAFLIDCADHLADTQYEYVVKLHSKKSTQDDYMVARYFKDHLIHNLLPSAGYANQLFTMLEEDPSIGIVFPPIISTGYPTLGHGWFTNRQGVVDLLERMGLSAPVDADTPLSPLGSMFICRREVLDPLLQLNLQVDEFPDNAGYRDGTLAHVIERAYSYVAVACGKRILTVLASDRAGRDFVELEYKLQRLANLLPAWPEEQERAIQDGTAIPSLFEVSKRRAQAQYPGLARRLKPAYGVARSLLRNAKRAITSLRTRETK